MGDRICSITGCGRVVRTREWCAMHYKRWYKTGDPLGLRPLHPPVEIRFWRRVSKTDGCWFWIGAVGGSGYGNFCPAANEWEPAHRFSWRLTNGPIPDDMFVCHICDEPLCVRPDHLFLGTHTDNMRDMLRKGRGRWGPNRLVRSDGSLKG